MKIEKRISATQMIKSTRENSNYLLLKQRSSAILLEKQIRQKLQWVEFNINKIEPMEKKKDKNLGFLPTLQKFIDYRNQQLENLKNEKRRKLIELLVIVVLRINYKMNIQALDILLYVGLILQKMSTYQYTLRQIVYRLIGVISNQIKNNKNIKFNTTTNRRLKHSITLMIGNVLAYNNFKQRFQARLRRSNLIVQKTFIEMLHEIQQTQIKLPQQIHPSLSNYNQLTINIDKESLTYSYEYPKLLQPFISVNNYRFFISKINQIIVPESRSHNFSSITRIYFVPLMLIFLLTSIFTLLIFIHLLKLQYDKLNQNINICMIILIVIVIMCSIYIYLQNNLYKNPLLVYNSMKQIVQKFGKQYQTKGMFLQLQHSIQYFYIYLKHSEQDQQSYTQSDDDSIQNSDSNSIYEGELLKIGSQHSLQKNIFKRMEIQDQIIEDQLVNSIKFEESSSNFIFCEDPQELQNSKKS